MMKLVRSIGLLLLAWGASAPAFAQVSLAPAFQDHAVLQRGEPLRIWGEAAPGARVTVRLDRHSARTRADAEGRWRATLPAMAAGGPYTLSARASEAEATARDVLIGDVWLCAGQSNMVLQVRRTLDSRAEIANAGSDRLRMMTVPLAHASTAQSVFGGPAVWQRASPETISEWSGACYYFARELQRRVDVPMGMIVAAWGGSDIRAWMGADALDAAGLGEGLALLRMHAADPASGVRAWGAMWESWWRGVSQSTPWRERGDDWAPAPAGLGHWEQWGVPSLSAYDGMVWYRGVVRLSAAQAASGAQLSLGRVDEVDQTWVNGVYIGGVSGAGEVRRYAVPDGALREGDNIIIVNALDTYATGGLYGPDASRALHLADGSVLPIADWRYRIANDVTARPPGMPWEATGGLGTIYNGMIAPIGPYNVRGVVWYQGESNVAQGLGYQHLLARFMADWRSIYGAELPFLVVQLAGYGPARAAPMDSAYAEVREAQRLAVLNDAHAALAVAIDLGERTDIHPANKQDIGRRLARAARALIFGEPITPSGPVVTNVSRAQGAVLVRFADVEGALIAYGANRPIGFELCGAPRGDCRFVDAILTDAVTVSLAIPEDFAPMRVRFCWADSPICNLYDGANLPAGPFEAPIAP